MLTVYKASAGSGKTYTLTYEYIRLILGHAHADTFRHILAVTFTKKATAEMKERILKELNLLSVSPDQSPYIKTLEKQLGLSAEQIRERAEQSLHAILQDYTRFAVMTIDSFFQQVVRSFAREVGLPAQYNIELNSDEVVNQAVDDLMFAMNHRQATREVSTWLSEFATDNIDNQRSWNPREDTKKLGKQLFSEQLQLRLNQLRTLLTDKEALRQYRQALDAIPADDKTARATADAIQSNLNTLGLLSDIWEQILRTNREQNRLPIAQVNGLLHRIIDDTDSPFIYEKLGTWLHHYMIDEFQDTSAMQWQNFFPLVAEADSNGYDNLIVGDIKQSIYRFRNSDWHQLQHVADQFLCCSQPVMGINYRSARTIVETNNELFERYVEWGAGHLQKEFKKLRPDMGDAIRQAYSTLHQDVQKKELSGYVALRWFDSKSADDLATMAEEEILSLLPELQARHYPLGRIAMLVRDRADASRITNLLLEHGYNVQSQEGLLVASHPAVQVLVMLLRLTIAPHDAVSATRLRHAYAEHLYPDNPTQATRFTLSNEPYFTPEQDEAVRYAQQLPLYEQVQHLISALELHEWPHATAYLMAFQDMIYAFSEQHAAEIGTFLQEWDSRQDKAVICSAPSDDAIQVMTIHKSKGLEFDVVILPYMDWSISPTRQDSSKILWCEPKEPPFNQMPLVPVSYGQALKKTYFCEEYLDETLNFYIDSLNLSYVAFTRPVQELYGFGQTAQKNDKGERLKVSTISQLLHTLLEDDSDFHDNCFQRGQKEEYVVEQKKADRYAMPTSTHTATYHVTPIGNRLRLSTRSIQDELSLQDFGTLMHDWLSLITTKDEAEERLQDMVRMGRAREQDLERMRTEWQRFLALIADRDWFDTKYDVLSERAILTASGQTLRPDRVMIDGKRAIVIDYKFGLLQPASHRDQVHDYMAELTRMGYQTEGYLVYVSLSQIVQV